MLLVPCCVLPLSHIILTLHQPNIALYQQYQQALGKVVKSANYVLNYIESVAWQICGAWVCVHEFVCVCVCVHAHEAIHLYA